MGRNSISFSKERISIVSSTCHSISASSEDFCWRVPIALFGAIIFIYINTYVAQVLSLFFRGGVKILANVTSGSVPGFVLGSNTIPSSPLNFFGIPVSGLSPDIQFSVLWLVLPVLFLIHSSSWLHYFPYMSAGLFLSLLRFLLFSSVCDIGGLCSGWSLICQIYCPTLSISGNNSYVGSAIYVMARLQLTYTRSCQVSQ